MEVGRDPAALVGGRLDARARAAPRAPPACGGACGRGARRAAPGRATAGRGCRAAAPRTAARSGGRSLRRRSALVRLEEERRPVRGADRQVDLVAGRPGRARSGSRGPARSLSSARRSPGPQHVALRRVEREASRRSGAARPSRRCARRASQSLTRTTRSPSTRSWTIRSTAAIACGSPRGGAGAIGRLDDPLAGERRELPRVAERLGVRQAAEHEQRGRTEHCEHDEAGERELRDGMPHRARCGVYDQGPIVPGDPPGGTLRGVEQSSHGRSDEMRQVDGTDHGDGDWSGRRSRPRPRRSRRTASASRARAPESSTSKLKLGARTRASRSSSRSTRTGTASAGRRPVPERHAGRAAASRRRAARAGRSRRGSSRPTGGRRPVRRARDQPVGRGLHRARRRSHRASASTGRSWQDRAVAAASRHRRDRLGRRRTPSGRRSSSSTGSRGSSMPTGSAQGRCAPCASGTAEARTSRSCSSAATSGTSSAGRRVRRSRRLPTTWFARRGCSSPSRRRGSGCPRSSRSARTTACSACRSTSCASSTGTCVTTALPAGLEEPGARRRLGEELVDALVEIHAADVAAPALAAFARPGSYLERQVRRFSQLWEINATRDLPVVVEVGRRLGERLPEPLPDTVVHGDYRLGNLMVERGRPDRVQAVLDWEMGAIGDPRADLGYLLATYTEPGGDASPLGVSPVTALEGFPTKAELVGRYVVAERQGRRAARLVRGARALEGRRLLRGDLRPLHAGRARRRGRARGRLREGGAADGGDRRRAARRVAFGS